MSCRRLQIHLLPFAHAALRAATRHGFGRSACRAWHQPAAKEETAACTAPRPWATLHAMLPRRLLSLVAALVLVCASADACAYAKAPQRESALPARVSTEQSAPSQIATATPSRIKEKCRAAPKRTLDACVFGDDLLAEVRYVALIGTQAPRDLADGGNDANARIGATTGTTALHYDGLGSTRLLSTINVDAGGAPLVGNEAITDQYQYTAFGESDLASTTGTTQNNYRFTGEQLDPNLGFYYLRARYMNPSQGRFVGTDRFMGNTSDPVSLHKFLYGNANPMMYTDPSGNAADIAQLGIGLTIQQTLIATTVAIGGTALAILAYEHAVTRARARAGAMACAASISMKQVSTRSPCGLNPFPMVFMRLSRIPAITEHTAASQAAGRPSLLHRTANASVIAANRVFAYAKCAIGATILPRVGDSCDEYPYASTYEGGGPVATVRFVPFEEQLSQGGTLSMFYSLCSIVPDAPGFNEFLVVPVLSAPISFSCGRFLN